jgi:hypothetical protein
MNKIVIILFLAIVPGFKGISQTATIHARVVISDREDSTSLTRFTINGQSFGERDTTIKIKVNQSGFDVCEAVGKHSSQKFLTRFKAGESYVIEQGCCCANFLLMAKKQPRRGTVFFKNVTNRDLGLVVAEANIDTVKAGKADTLFSLESAMCLFKPCGILLTETAYLSDEYNYHSDNRNYKKLWEEQAQYILGETWFHFLHGEKIEIEYLEASKSVRIKLLGYLTKSEYKEWLEK